MFRHICEMQRISDWILLLLQLIGVFRTTDCDLIVDTKYGKIRGLITSRSQAFLGVPYASPPVGKLRWTPPQPPRSWAPGIYNATETKPGCTQVQCEAMNPSEVCPKKSAEDCLFLYIWAPLSTTPTSGLPVMVYLHGGNFIQMSGGSLIFNGEYIAQKGGVIHVNVEYRLGALGFLYTGGREEDARGNYGLKDQRHALLWVKENIANFGGDPNKVTLYGQSAGAQSTLVHLMSNKTAGLFRNAIVESAPLSIPFKTETEALFLSTKIAELLGCHARNMTCFRSKTAVEIETAQHASRTSVTSPLILEFFEPLGPYVDGDEVPMQPISAIQKGYIRNVPIMLGTLTEETQIYIYEAWHKPLSAEVFIAIAFGLYPSKFLDILAEYPPLNSTDNRELLEHVGTDFIFTCSARNATRSMIAGGNPKVWRYEFDHAFSFPGWGNFTFCNGHVCHGSEIIYLFHTAQLGGYNFTAAEEKLSESLIGYWTNFAHTSDPNKGPTTLSPWPQLTTTKEDVLHFVTPANTIWSNYRQKFCDFWDVLGYSA